MFAEYLPGILMLVFLLAGFAAIVTEILIKDPKLFGEIATDVEKMARPERPRVTQVRTYEAPEFRRAA